jgi:hypothetical protein
MPMYGRQKDGCYDMRVMVVAYSGLCIAPLAWTTPHDDRYFGAWLLGTAQLCTADLGANRAGLEKARPSLNSAKGGQKTSTV